MALFINNEHVKELIEMKMTMEALEQSYALMSQGEAVCRPRVDLVIPTSSPDKNYQFGTMDGGAARGYAAIRMKSDIVYQMEKEGNLTEEKYSVSPGLFCGLIFLFRVENGEPLAILNDGMIQQYRVGADSGIGAKYMAKEGEVTVGMLGSGGMARSHIEAIREVRTIKRIKVYSPTKENCERYAREMKEKYSIETVCCEHPQEVHQGVDILCSCTDASIPVIRGAWLEPGTHITSIDSTLDEEAYLRVDRYLRFGNATAPKNKSADEDIVLSYVTPVLEEKKSKTRRLYAHHVIDAAKRISYADILMGTPGRTLPEQITFSERGNLQGAQFHAVAGKLYEEALGKGIGHVIPTEWFLQDIRS